MSPFSPQRHPLADLVRAIRTERRVPDEWRRRHEDSLAELWRECAEPGVLLDVIFLFAPKDTWVEASRAVIDRARTTAAKDVEDALRDVCDAARAIVPEPPSLDSLVESATMHSARELDTMGYAAPAL